MTAIAKSLQNVAMEDIDVNSNVIGDEGCINFCYFLKNQRTLRKFRLFDNQIGDEGI